MLHRCFFVDRRSACVSKANVRKAATADTWKCTTRRRVSGFRSATTASLNTTPASSAANLVWKRSTSSRVSAVDGSSSPPPCPESAAGRNRSSATVTFNFHWNSIPELTSVFLVPGIESTLDDCDVRMSSQAFDHIYSCPWDSESFVFVHCGDSNLAARQQDYWGGIRFSVASFEENLLEQRRLGLPLRPTAAQQLQQQRERQSRLHYVNITGAGILHGERSPAVLSVLRSPFIQQVNITHCASDGISLISPSYHLPLLDNRSVLEHTFSHFSRK